ncbi:hypothetical protein Afil01_49990 [Actinorhabdospora filicis]|uniref:Peptidase C14 caspase domain-containing protein n=1 Tax=Actinorhabdospora filicis TaxID=1785913 RepID=A0A9W6SQU8_9ACTN|nr:caspase family protein [Actinorhabdospora filicis]GLZ80192.1 hypothetical protein Afil01_49990 [Actinorhabdospora filicis]
MDVILSGTTDAVTRHHRLPPPDFGLAGRDGLRYQVVTLGASGVRSRGRSLANGAFRDDAGLTERTTPRAAPAVIPVRAPEPARSAPRAYRLPVPERSSVVLMGTSVYTDPRVPSLPAVAANLAELRAALTGLFGEAVRTLAEPALTDLADIARSARSGSDTFVFYYAGHGFIGSDGRLYLGLRETDTDMPAFTALPYERIAQIIRDSPARDKVVILDCCFSGRALKGTMSPTPLATADTAGTWVLTASSSTAMAFAPVGERLTAFTGALVEILRQGVDNGEPVIRVGDLFAPLADLLASRALPVPQQRTSRSASDLALAPNPLGPEHLPRGEPS